MTTVVSTTKILSAPGIGAVELTVEERGEGKPFLVLHGSAGPQSVAEFAQLLVKRDNNRVITPTHPGEARTGSHPGNLIGCRPCREPCPGSGVFGTDFPPESPEEGMSTSNPRACEPRCASGHQMRRSFTVGEPPGGAPDDRERGEHDQSIWSSGTDERLGEGVNPSEVAGQLRIEGIAIGNHAGRNVGDFGLVLIGPDEELEG